MANEVTVSIKQSSWALGIGVTCALLVSAFMFSGQRLFQPSQEQMLPAPRPIEELIVAQDGVEPTQQSRVLKQRSDLDLPSKVISDFKPSAGTPISEAWNIWQDLYSSEQRRVNCEKERRNLVDLAIKLAASESNKHLYQWTKTVIHRCFNEVLLGNETNKSFIEKLIQSTKDEYFVLLLLDYYRGSGELEAAVAYVEEFGLDQVSALVLDRYGRIQLMRAEVIADPEIRLSILEAADSAYQLALAAVGEPENSWMIVNAARVRLGLGDFVAAISLAERAYLNSYGSGRYSRTGDIFSQAALTASIGEIYARAGMKETGLAFIDQAISSSPDQNQRDLLGAIRAQAALL